MHLQPVYMTLNCTARLQTSSPLEYSASAHSDWKSATRTTHKVVSRSKATTRTNHQMYQGPEKTWVLSWEHSVGSKGDRTAICVLFPEIHTPGLYPPYFVFWRFSLRFFLLYFSSLSWDLLRWFTMNELIAMILMSPGPHYGTGERRIYGAGMAFTSFPQARSSGVVINLFHEANCDLGLM
jgi:hypothetical protein